MEHFNAAAVERMMKVQEVLLRAISKQITWWQAAEIIGISDRQMRRWKKRLECYGYDGLYDRRKGKPSPRRVPLEVAEQVLRLYREKYFDLNVRHFHEKLQGEHGIELSYTWVKQALQGRGWWHAGASAEYIANGGLGGPCRGCCCTSTAAGIAGSRTSAGTT